MLALLAQLGLVTAQETTVNVQQTSPLPTFSSEKPLPPKTVQARGIVYTLSELGKAAYRENVNYNFFDGQHHGFCYGEPWVVEIVNYSEPADLFGQKVSEVHFKYAVYNLASWINVDAIKRVVADQAVNSIASTRRLKDIADTMTRHTQSQKVPLEEKAVLILTNNGWMHEKMFRKR